MLFDKMLMGEQLKFDCDVFVLYNAIWPDGSLIGCCEYPFVVGNVLKQSPKEFLSKTKIREKKLRKKCNGACNTVLYRELSLLFRQPIYKNIISAKNILRKVN